MNLASFEAKFELWIWNHAINHHALLSYKSGKDIMTIKVTIHGEGNGSPLQYACLENPMDRGAWWATV